MSSVHAGPAPARYRALELQKYLAWSPALLGGVIALLGGVLAGGGAYLASLGGSLYYVLVGATLIAAGFLMIKGRIAGFYTYVGAFAFTAVWSFWEVGLSGWELIPRLVGPFVLLVLAYMRAWRVKKFFRDRHFFSSYVSRGPRASAVLHLMARQALCLAALSGHPPEPGGSRRKARGVDGESARRATIGCPAITLQT